MVQADGGGKLPEIGFGTSEIANDAQGIEKIVQALACGYRLIDTAAAYENEQAVGQAVKRAEKELGIKRQEIMISSKLANDAQGYESALHAFEETQNHLELDYLDIYLIHWPVPRDREDDYKELNIASWEAMEKLKKQGKVRMIGVCNFLQRHLQNLIENCDAAPQINQIEMHPRYQQRELLRYCKEQGIAVEAWGPFRNGRIFGEQQLREIADKHGATVAQTCLQWIAAEGAVPLPKSSTRQRMEENLEFSHVKLDADDIAAIHAMDEVDGHADYWNYKRQLRY